MDENGPSLPEIARRLNEVFARFDQTVSDLPRTFVSRELFNAREELYKSEHTRLQQLIDERKAQMDAKIAEQQRRITDLEDDKTWLYRLVIGAVILALVGLALGGARLTSHSSSPKKTGLGQVTASCALLA